MSPRGLLALALLAAALSGSSVAANAGSIPGVRLANFSQSEELTRLENLIEDRLRFLAGHLALQPEQSQLDTRALRGVWDNIVALLKSILKAIRLLLDPTPLGNFDLQFNSSSFTGYLNLKAVYLRHLKDLVVQKYFINIFTMCAQVDLLLPQFTIGAYYQADLNLRIDEAADSDWTPIFGAGEAQIDMKNIKIPTKVCVGFRPTSLKVSELNLSVESDTVNLSGLFGGGAISDLISGIASDVVPAMIQEFQTELTQFIMNYVNEYIKRHLLPETDTTSLSPVIIRRENNTRENQNSILIHE